MGKHGKPAGQPKPIPLREGGDKPAQGGKHAGKDGDQKKGSGK